jgi:hypothetical protein
MVLFLALKLFRKRLNIEQNIPICVLLADFITSICLIILGLIARCNGLYIVYNLWFCNFTVLFFDIYLIWQFIMLD